jgi:hypothetical protein
MAGARNSYTGMIRENSATVSQRAEGHIVLYALCHGQDTSSTSLRLAQLRASIKSLRRTGYLARVYVFGLGVPRLDIEDVLDGTNITIICEPSYQKALYPHCGVNSTVFEKYPVLARWLALKELGRSAEAVLYVDTDTCFLSNPTKLFEGNTACDWYAREEPCSSHSHLGYNPNYLNEATLANIARQVGSRLLYPMNLGVILMRNAVWEKVDSVLDRFFIYMWRFLAWMVSESNDQIPQEPRMQRTLEVVAATVTEDDTRDALVYPSSNLWIVDEIAMLLALGHIDGFSCNFFKRSDVIQGYEFAAPSFGVTERSGSVLCHYYTKNEKSFSQWYKDHLLRS